jgi:type III pantothenate kinase
MSAWPLIAVDIGNRRAKFGLFGGGGVDGLPEPEQTLAIDGARASDWDALDAWLARRRRETLSWWIGSVNRPTATGLIDWLRNRRPDDAITLLAACDLSLGVSLARPDMVGIDRLLDALAADTLRTAGRPAVVVDIGSAITVDLISREGVFQGGAILPGIAMSARAMHTFTDLLPLIDMRELTSPPPAAGDCTEGAMRSGLFWGAVGAIRELVEQLAGRDADRVEVFLTGGAGPAVARLLGRDARHVPHLTLAGIALAARATQRRAL